ncbi:hypothetical protein I4F81_005846 [Pyropia yezoensis]|uniref:Uncharacterized protein n=1 Tax=Pyropia yezoensis TaxID=2788 RepID=A0ACC3BZI6_PYRYE|nr:hypothetical protein I4F81_005846 [Neopyropia yezoensis]
MSMSAVHTEAVNIAYAEAVFAAGGKFGYCTDEEEWGPFWNKLIGTAWRPSSRNVMTSKYIDVVFLKVDKTTANVLVEKAKEQMELVSPFRGDSWRERSNTGFVSDSPNVNRGARKKLLEADVFSFSYGCVSHAMNNLFRDIPKLPSALRALAFCTALAKFFCSHHLPREHLRVESMAEPRPPPTLKLFSPTQWKGSASLLSTTLKTRSAITTALFMAKKKVIDMDIPPSLFDARIVFEP